MATEATQEAAKRSPPEAKQKPARKAKPRKPATKKAAKPTKTKRRATKAKPANDAKSRKAATKPAAKPKARRKQTSPTERRRILTAAEREGLTAIEVQKRLGIKPVTYYSWRKKAGTKRPRGRPVAARLGRSSKVGVSRLAGPDIAGQIRQALRSEIARLLPEMIQSEVAAMLGDLSGRGGSKR